MRLTQGNLRYVADLAVKGNARAKVDFDNGRQAVCAPILDLHRKDIFGAFLWHCENPRGKDFRSINRFIAWSELAERAALSLDAGLILCRSRERLNDTRQRKQDYERPRTKHASSLELHL
jgi:hypothetical protein